MDDSEFELNLKSEIKFKQWCKWRWQYQRYVICIENRKFLQEIFVL